VRGRGKSRISWSPMAPSLVSTRGASRGIGKVSLHKTGSAWNNGDKMGVPYKRFEALPAIDSQFQVRQVEAVSRQQRSDGRQTGRIGQQCGIRERGSCVDYTVSTRIYSAK